MAVPRAVPPARTIATASPTPQTATFSASSVRLRKLSSPAVERAEALGNVHPELVQPALKSIQLVTQGVDLVGEPVVGLQQPPVGVLYLLREMLGRNTRHFTIPLAPVESLRHESTCPDRITGPGRTPSPPSLRPIAESRRGRESNEQRIRPAASEVERLLAGTDLAQRLWGWQPRYSLEQGLDETIAWVEKNLHRFRVDAYTT